MLGETRRKPLRQYKYLTFLTMLFITVFVICDTTAFRMVSVFGKELPLSGFIIPIIFLVGDITAEVYGYRITMKMLVAGIICQCIFGVLIRFSLWVAPSAPGNLVNLSYNVAFEHILRANFTSCFSVTAGMLANAFLISKMKIYMNGKRFWVRTLLSSGFSELVLCTVAYLILFTGLRNFGDIISIIYTVWIYKIVFSVAATPFASMIAELLKHLEYSDVYDTGISYIPFRFRKKINYIVGLEQERDKWEPIFKNLKISTSEKKDKIKNKILYNFESKKKSIPLKCSNDIRII